jgi:hypothetical protein
MSISDILHCGLQLAGYVANLIAPLVLPSASASKIVRMPEARLKFQLPIAQVLAPGVLHLHRPDPAPRVFHLIRRAIDQTFAPNIFHLNRHAMEQALAPAVFYLHCRDLASRIFHLYPHFIRQALAPSSLFSTEIRLTQTAGCSLLNIAHCGLAPIQS